MPHPAPSSTRRTLVLDDDPTGSQCAGDVPVLLDDGAVYAFLSGPGHAAFALTNTRALTEPQAVSLVARWATAAREHGVDVVLRGDSTLRGHTLAELRAAGLDRRVALVVPAFPAAGRVTLQGQHYLRERGRLVNVADTEFARDPVFPVRARSLAAWIADQDAGRATRTLPLEDLRSGGAPAVETALAQLPLGGILLPDVETDDDLGLLAAGYLQATTSRAVLLRSAAPLAAQVAGVPGRRLPPVHDRQRVLVVCGSHMAASSRQLQAVTRLTGPPTELDTARLLGPHWHTEADRAAAAVRRCLDAVGCATLSTARDRSAQHGGLDHGAAVMRGLTAAVRLLREDVDAVVAKGGITSAEVVRTGLAAHAALVEGQVEVGVSRWRVEIGAERVIAVVVVPGNVGDDETLVRAVGALRPT